MSAHRFVPLSAPRSTKAFGWDPLPDRASRLRAFVAAYGMDIPLPYLVDLLIVRHPRSRRTSSTRSGSAHQRCGKLNVDVLTHGYDKPGEFRPERR